jgi:hypothetical protein
MRLGFSFCQESLAGDDEAKVNAALIGRLADSWFHVQTRLLPKRQLIVPTISIELLSSKNLLSTLINTYRK